MTKKELEEKVSAMQQRLDMFYQIMLAMNERLNNLYREMEAKKNVSRAGRDY